jgi:hypothetical protein
MPHRFLTGFSVGDGLAGKLVLMREGGLLSGASQRNRTADLHDVNVAL